MMELLLLCRALEVCSSDWMIDLGGQWLSESYWNAIRLEPHYAQDVGYDSVYTGEGVNNECMSMAAHIILEHTDNVKMSNLLGRAFISFYTQDEKLIEILRIRPNKPQPLGPLIERLECYIFATAVMEDSDEST